MIQLSASVHDRMVAACLEAWPLEACGLLAGPVASDQSAPAVAEVSFEVANAAASSRVYAVAPGDLLRADREAEAAGLELIGVWHSHTHTDAYPSPTDVAQAPDPGWHYVLVSLRDVHPAVRSYRINGDEVEEEPVTVQ